jgi:hypothetical protein
MLYSTVVLNDVRRVSKFVKRNGLYFNKLCTWSLSVTLVYFNQQ